MTDASALAAPPVRRRFVVFYAALTLLLAVAAAWWWYGRPGSDAASSTPVVAGAPSVRPPAVTSSPVPAAAVQRVQPDLQSSQLADLERVNNVLRQQVLALTERVRIIGEQLAAHRLELLAAGGSVDQSGAPTLALAEQWLELGQARFELFDDARGALLALDAADRALISSTDPRVLSLRQTLAIEREALRALPWLDTVSLAGQFQAWQDGLRDWPQWQIEGVEVSEQKGWAARLDRYFRVRKLDAGLSARPEARRDEIAAELAWARILLVRGETAALRASLERVLIAIKSDFVADDPGVAAAVTGLQRVVDSLGQSEPATRLGATLLELRAFNGAPEPTPAPLPAVQSPAAEAPPVTELPQPVPSDAESSSPQDVRPEAPVPEQPVEPPPPAGEPT